MGTSNTGQPPGFAQWVADMLGWGHPLGRAQDCLNGGYATLEGEDIHAVLRERLDNARKNLDFVNADKLTWQHFRPTPDGKPYSASATNNVYNPLYALLRDCALAGHSVSGEARTIWYGFMEILPRPANQQFLGGMNARTIESIGWYSVEGGKEQGARRAEFLKSAFAYLDEMYPLGIALLDNAGGSDFVDQVLTDNIQLIRKMIGTGEMPALLDDRLVAPALHVATITALRDEALRGDHGRAMARLWEAQHAEGKIGDQTRDRIRALIEERLGFDPARA